MSVRKITRTVKVNGESTVIGVKCTTERISPRPRTITKMSQREKKSMVVQGIKDRSKIRTRRRVSVRQRGDLGEIQGRSIDLRRFGVQGCWREYEEGRCWCREQGDRKSVV